MAENDPQVYTAEEWGGSMLFDDELSEDDYPLDGTTNLAWHYTDQFALTEILTKHALRASRADLLNDSTELTDGIKLLTDAWKVYDRSDLTPYQVTYIDRVVEIASEWQGHVYVLCAALHWDILGLWRNYAGSRGYAIGLRTEDKLAVLASAPVPSDDRSDLERSWHTVAYGPREKECSMQTLLAALVVQSAGFDAFPPGQDELRELNLLADTIGKSSVVQVIANMKDKGFAEEREIRYVLSNPRFADSDVLHFRSGPFSIVPYLALTGSAGGELFTDAEKKGNFQLPINYIAVGPGPYEKEACRAVRQLLNSNGYGNVKIIKTRTTFRG